ncbi:tail assembly protein [Xanthomonas phage JGB6]|nr:tail assembly protein [Xanthomonas phage JGB6]
MACQFVGFEAYMNEAKSRGMGFSVFVGKKNVTRDQLTDLVGSEEIRIVCVPLGAKRAGWLQVILGVVLIVVGAFTSWSGGTALIQLGVSMVIGGVLQLLTPIPKVKTVIAVTQTPRTCLTALLIPKLKATPSRFVTVK